MVILLKLAYTSAHALYVSLQDTEWKMLWTKVIGSFSVLVFKQKEVMVPNCYAVLSLVTAFVLRWIKSCFVNELKFAGCYDLWLQQFSLK